MWDRKQFAARHYAFCCLLLFYLLVGVQALPKNVTEIIRGYGKKFLS